ncbi:hypothetical protein [Nocardioides cynanchi]|uniref:hypothetical protein n=1 Tax=Nocardioides cynanchi TaxID=2558918 RepID=UPI0017827714|nr:hypothetical protein [Nocardioides cynanchi]
MRGVPGADLALDDLEGTTQGAASPASIGTTAVKPGLVDEDPALLVVVAVA